MPDSSINVVTGAFGYTGKYIARRLLADNEAVVTLTGHPDRDDPFDGRVRAAPYDFDKSARLVETLRGASTLFNTYWVRFSHGEATFEQAVANTKVLIDAARRAGVRRFVHISITNPSLDSPLPYFRGKAELEGALRSSGLSYAIIRPTVVFGREDILVNNIGWLLRRFPLFVVPGGGDYRLQPVFVEDLADIAVDAARRGDDVVLDAVGPETYTFRELVHLIAGTVGGRARIISSPRWIALLAARLIGRAVGDVVLTADEARGLMSNLLISGDPPTGNTCLSEWLARNADHLGRSYASELRRHFA